MIEISSTVIVGLSGVEPLGTQLYFILGLAAPERPVLVLNLINKIFSFYITKAFIEFDQNKKQNYVSVVI